MTDFNIKKVHPTAFDAVITVVMATSNVSREVLAVYVKDLWAMHADMVDSPERAMLEQIIRYWQRSL